MDLACGDAEAGVHAGLLVRAIRKIAAGGGGTIVEGPSLVVDAVLAGNHGSLHDAQLSPSTNPVCKIGSKTAALSKFRSFAACRTRGAHRELLSIMNPP
eukprot:2398074-Amphidinium_carterae.1